MRRTHACELRYVENPRNHYSDFRFPFNFTGSVLEHLRGGIYNDVTRLVLVSIAADRRRGISDVNEREWARSTASADGGCTAAGTVASRAELRGSHAARAACAAWTGVLSPAL